MNQLTLPIELLDALEGSPGFHRQAFVEAHEREAQVVSLRINPMKGLMPTQLPAQVSSVVPWTNSGYYLEQRPSFTFDPLFHAGCYYVQEASSMFLEQAVRQLLPADNPVKALDLCGAPGGKSTHLQSLLPPQSLLVSNEVIRTRVPVLIDNIIRWGGSNVVVTSQDPSAFGNLGGYFDLMVVDAPCSGSGLFRKDVKALDEWSPANVTLCSQRQQRILADALTSLKQEGLLIYSTCSYSMEEDERIADWIAEQELESCRLQLDPSWGVVETQSPSHNCYGYRFYPHLVKGEGFFLACFRKKTSESSVRFRPEKIERVPEKHRKILQEWLAAPETFDWIAEEEGYSAMPVDLMQDLRELFSAIRLRYKGIKVGQLMKERLVPDHALALSAAVRADIPHANLDREDAVRYLQRRELKGQVEGRGWMTARFQNHNLGWINVLPGRINNYYPKELRILKDSPGGFEK